MILIRFYFSDFRRLTDQRRKGKCFEMVTPMLTFENRVYFHCFEIGTPDLPDSG